MAQQHVKWGHHRGGEASVRAPLAASQTPVARSSYFVYKDGSGNLVLAGDGANEIFGHAEVAAKAYSLGDMVKVIVDPTAIFRIPILAGTYARTMDGKTCDIKVSGSRQGADLATADDDVLIVVDGDLVNNEWVDVMINQKERAQSGVV